MLSHQNTSIAGFVCGEFAVERKGKGFDQCTLATAGYPTQGSGRKHTVYRLVGCVSPTDAPTTAAPTTHTPPATTDNAQTTTGANTGTSNDDDGDDDGAASLRQYI